MLGPVRVLSVGNMYPPHHLGGYELMWRSAVLHVRASGHEVRVLTTDHREPAPDPALPEDPDVHRELRWYWRDHRFPRLPLRERLRLERRNISILRRHLTEFEPDVVSWWAMGGMSLSLIQFARRVGLPAIGVVVDDWLVYGPRVDQWQRACRRLGPFSHPVALAAGVPAELPGDGVCWLFVSDAVRQHALATGRAVDGEVVHGGVDRALFREQPERPWAGRLLYVGRLDPRKGIETAVRALGSLPDASLEIIGSGDPDYVRSLDALASELGVGERMRIARRDRSQLPEAYAEADITLFPVLWEEPWGLVPLESMAVGTPVIATGAGGSAEYLRDRENCLIFEPRDDPSELAAAIRRLADEPELRRRVRNGGLATASRYEEAHFNDGVLHALEAAVR
jgi:glycogen synthase